MNYGQSSIELLRVCGIAESGFRDENYPENSENPELLTPSLDNIKFMSSQDSLNTSTSVCHTDADYHCDTMVVKA